jgi:hypothetical protein
MDSEDVVRKFHQKRGRIRDPEKIHPGSGSRIQGVKKHRIPDPDPQHWMTVIINHFWHVSWNLKG